MLFFVVVAAWPVIVHSLFVRSPQNSKITNLLIMFSFYRHQAFRVDDILARGAVLRRHFEGESAAILKVDKEFSLHSLRWGSGGVIDRKTLEGQRKDSWLGRLKREGASVRRAPR